MTSVIPRTIQVALKLVCVEPWPDWSHSLCSIWTGTRIPPDSCRHPAGRPLRPLGPPLRPITPAGRHVLVDDVDNFHILLRLAIDTFSSSHVHNFAEYHCHLLETHLTRCAEFHLPRGGGAWLVRFIDVEGGRPPQSNRIFLAIDLGGPNTAAAFAATMSRDIGQARSKRLYGLVAPMDTQGGVPLLPAILYCTFFSSRTPSATLPSGRASGTRAGRDYRGWRAALGVVQLVLWGLGGATRLGPPGSRSASRQRLSQVCLQQLTVSVGVRPDRSMSHWAVSACRHLHSMMATLGEMIGIIRSCRSTHRGLCGSQSEDDACWPKVQIASVLTASVGAAVDRRFSWTGFCVACCDAGVAAGRRRDDCRFRVRVMPPMPRLGRSRGAEVFWTEPSQIALQRQAYDCTLRRWEAGR